MIRIVLWCEGIGGSCSGLLAGWVREWEVVDVHVKGMRGVGWMIWACCGWVRR
jgi:hypothetical protein